MENPLDTTTNPQEALASRLQRLEERIAQLERSRTVPATITGASLAAIKAQLPSSAPDKTLVVGRLTAGGAYLYVYEAAVGAWYRSSVFVAA